MNTRFYVLFLEQEVNFIHLTATALAWLHHHHIIPHHYHYLGTRPTQGAFWAFPLLAPNS